MRSDMSVYMKMEGFREVERALAALPQGTAKGVAGRLMKKQLKSVADMANTFWPGSSTDVFRVTSKIARGQVSDSLMQRNSATVNMFVGAPGGKKGTPHAHLIEFGTGPRHQKGGRYTGQVSPQPMLQPAWDAHKSKILKGLAASLGAEIEKTVARRAKRAAK